MPEQQNRQQRKPQPQRNHPGASTGRTSSSRPNSSNRPKHQGKGSKYRNKKQTSSSPAVAPKKTGPVKVYNCTVCAEVVTKKPVSASAVIAGKEGKQKVGGAGLGKFRCKCGNTKVKASFVKPAAVEVVLTNGSTITFKDDGGGAVRGVPSA